MIQDTRINWIGRLLVSVSVAAAFLVCSQHLNASQDLERRLLGSESIAGKSPQAQTARSKSYPRQRPLISKSIQSQGNGLDGIAKALRDRGNRKARRVSLSTRQLRDIKNQFGPMRSDVFGDQVRRIEGNLPEVSELLASLSAASISRTLKQEKRATYPGLGELTRYQVFQNGLPVWGEQVVQQTMPNKRTFLGSLLPEGDQAEIDVSEGLDTALAKSIALAHVGRLELELSDAAVEPVIHTIGSRKKKYFKVDLIFIDDYQIVFVDPTTSRAVHSYSNKQSAVVAGSGIDLNGVTWNIGVWEEDGLFYLYDPTTPQGSETIVVDFQNLDSSTNFRYITANSPIGSWDPAGISAYVGQLLTYEYFLTTFGRNSFDDDGGALIGAIHVGQNHNNASWDGTSMYFGDGDGVVFSSLAGCLDVTAHEISHGVVQTTAGLVYENQSGALNESFADIFGAMVDREDWLLGEDCSLQSPGFLRSLKNPQLGDQPSHISEYLNVPSSQDHGGVHTNSGIPNRAAYLLAEGLSEEGLGQSIGRSDTEQIFYAALLMLTSGADFLDARLATITAAETLFGVESLQAISVAAAWDVVGVTASLLPTSMIETARAVQLDGVDTMVYLFPADGSHDKPFDTSELYQIYAQILPSPFIGYDSELDIGPLNDIGQPKYSRPAYFSEDGEPFIVYVGTDSELYGIDPDGEIKLSEGGDFNSVSIAQDGSHIALTLNNDASVAIIDVNTGLSSIYDVGGPDFTRDGKIVQTVTRVDSISFNYSGEKVIFDFASCVPTFEEDCSGSEPSEYWGVGVLNLRTEGISYPFPSQPSDVDVGFPRFASTSDRYMVFDLIDFSNFDQNQKADSGVVMFDFERGSFQFVVNPDISSNKQFVFGMPSFSGDDDYIVFQALDDEFGLAYRIDLDDYVVVPNSIRSINNFDVALPFVHRNAVLDVRSELSSDTALVDFGAVPLGSQSTASVRLANSGNKELEITGILKSSDLLSISLQNRRIAPGETVTFELSINMDGGSKSEDLTIQHTGANPSLQISVLASEAAVQTDTDGDGNPDSTDLDDDSDGVADASDAFPLDADESIDTDSDGTGNNADSDDDGDGVDDAADTFPLNASESVDTDGDGTGNNSDPDDDNDSVLDTADAFPLDSSRSANSRLANISTRDLVRTGDEVVIGGLIITGSEPKTVVIRARGPSLSDADPNLSNLLQDPFIQLFSGATLMDSNDNWQDHAASADIRADLKPSRTSESVILTTLDPGAYTAIVRGTSETTGIGIVEIFEVTDTGNTRITNISTRGYVGTGDDVLIGGVIISGETAKTVTIRARGPSLADADSNLQNLVTDPLLQLFDSAGQLIDTNDNWQDHSSAGTIRADLQPSRAAESAITVALEPGAYTAIVRGVNETAGIGIVEVFEID